MMNISVIGAGVVGRATGMGFSELGHNVIFHDIVEERILELKEKGFKTAPNIRDAISQSDFSFICVDTPNREDGNQDLSKLIAVISEIAKTLETTKKFQLVSIRSTILPGTMKNVVLNFFDKHCSKKRGRDYDVCYNPEFLRERTALEDFKKSDRIIIGENAKGSALPLVELYKPLTDKIVVTTFEAAEMIKYASNCFLSLKISFFNEIGIICKKLNIDEEMVSYGVSLDKRIGKYGVKAGKPFGGGCLPKDTEALATFVDKLQVNPNLPRTALAINNKVKMIYADKKNKGLVKIRYI